MTTFQGRIRQMGVSEGRATFDDVVHIAFRWRAFADQHWGAGEKPMVDVIGAGFGRTGTASLKVALEHLGLGPCHHMFEVVAHPELLPRWERVVAGEDVDWDEVLEGYRSTVDWPGCTYWRGVEGG